jgi:hypothetical protein
MFLAFLARFIGKIKTLVLQVLLVILLQSSVKSLWRVRVSVCIATIGALTLHAMVSMV